ncbi:hypothetical protein FUT83_13495 [Treponema phagedenis]|nr:hypothetical protein FUT83_13495 [Treponema phagedenis]QEK10370.1 hypothetical protein FUT81_13630 [Treponema phagedenis]TYT79094.1 hypothetical protein FS559_08255 [Treponema phagedenis]
MAVVPNRNDVLKQSGLQSFKTRGLGFCHGRQNSARARTPVVPRRIEFENYHSILGVFKLIGLVLTRMSKPNMDSFFLNGALGCLAPL